jgi:hypothetical protein
MSLFPIIRSTEGVKAAKDRLLAEAMGLDKDVQNCGALDATTRASWGLWYASLVDFARQDVPFIGTDQFSTQVDTFVTALDQWKKQLGGTCALSSPIFTRTQPNQELSAIVQVAQYATIAAGVIGGAYAIGKLVELAEIIPHKR